MQHAKLVAYLMSKRAQRPRRRSTHGTPGTSLEVTCAAAGDQDVEAQHANISNAATPAAVTARAVEHMTEVIVVDIREISGDSLRSHQRPIGVGAWKRICVRIHIDDWGEQREPNRQFLFIQVLQSIYL